MDLFVAVLIALSCMVSAAAAIMLFLPSRSLRDAELELQDTPTRSPEEELDAAYMWLGGALVALGRRS